MLATHARKTFGLLLAGAAVCGVSWHAYAQAVEPAPKFQRLPYGMYVQMKEALHPASNPNALSESRITPDTTGLWSQMGNLGNIVQTQTLFYEYFTPPNTVPSVAKMTNLQYGWDARNGSKYNLTVFLCIGNTNTCVNVSSAKQGSFNLTGQGYLAKQQVFFAMEAITGGSVVIINPPIYAFGEVVYVSYAY